jgi:hypothetical protein
MRAVNQTVNTDVITAIPTTSKKIFQVRGFEDG